MEEIVRCLDRSEPNITNVFECPTHGQPCVPAHLATVRFKCIAEELGVSEGTLANEAQLIAFESSHPV